MGGRQVPVWTLGDRIRKAREVAGLSQAEVAEHVGVSRKTIVNYESGRMSPRRPLDLVEQLGELTGVSPVWLLTGEAQLGQ